MHSARTEQEKARPDHGELAKHLGDTFSDFWWEKLLFLTVDCVLLYADIVRITEPAHHDAKSEPSEAKPANNQTTDETNALLEMTPASLQCS